jgi:hypothetical protein
MKLRYSALYIFVVIGLVAGGLLLAGRESAGAGAAVLGPEGTLFNSHDAGKLPYSASEGKADTVKNKRLMQANDQLRQLLQLARTQAEGEWTTVVKWQGMMSTDAVGKRSVEQAAGLLATRLSLPSPEQENVQGHKVYATESSQDGMTGKLSVMKVDDALYIVYRLEGTLLGTDASTVMLDRQQEAGGILLESGVDAAWNASVQGLAQTEAGQVKMEHSSPDKGSNQPSSKDVSETLAQMEKAAQSLQVGAIDSFQDGTTVSRTYAVPSFGLTALIHGKQVGLQMAVHTDTVTGRQEISFGSPMLTIEY